MTALLYIIAICAFALVACLLAWFYERDLIDEAARIAADNDWSDWDALSDSDSPIHDALAIERFHQQLADDDLIRRAEGWGA